MLEVNRYRILLFAGVLQAFSLWASDTAEGDAQAAPQASPSANASAKKQINRIVEDSSYSRAKLFPAGKRFIADDSAKLEFVGEARCRESKSIDAINAADHKLHYLLGEINKVIYQQTKVSRINYLMLALDGVILKQNGHLERKTFPILFDRSSGQYTLSANAHTEHVIFLSYPHERAKEYKKVIKQSQHNALTISAAGDDFKVYFYPNRVYKDDASFGVMRGLFPFLAADENYDSEIHAIYSLLQNESLISDFIRSVEIDNRFLSVGLRYYSFLDTCERCQRFLNDNQSHLKSLFVKALRAAYPDHADVAFLTFAHGNRVYGKNTYKVLEEGSDGEVSEKILVPIDGDCGLAGGAAGKFLPDDFTQYNGKMIPSTQVINSVVTILHEPDLGKDGDEALARQYFANSEEIDFQQEDYTDEHAGVLHAKLKRMKNPLIVKRFNISGNSVGKIMPDFLDDGIELTPAKELMEIIEILSTCSNLEELDLSHNNISSYSCFNKLRSSLISWKGLRKLILEKTEISKDIFTHIASQLESLARLEVLNLNYNFIYAEGAEVLIGLLPKLAFLKELHIGYAALCHADGRTRYDDPDTWVYSPESFLKLAAAIADHPSIEKVDIGHYIEQIGEKDLKEFIKEVKKNPKVQIVGKRRKFESFN